MKIALRVFKKLFWVSEKTFPVNIVFSFSYAFPVPIPFSLFTDNL